MSKPALEDLPLPRKWHTQAENCLRVVRQVHECVMSGVPADHALVEIFHDNHQYGSRDRRFFTSAVFSRYRWLGIIGNTPLRDVALSTQILISFLADGVTALTPGNGGGALIGTEATPPLRIWLDSLDDSQKARYALAADCNCSDPLQRLSIFLDAPLTLEMMLPQTAYDFLRTGMAETPLNSYLKSLQFRSPVWCRICKSRQAEVESELRRLGYEFMPHPIHLESLRFQNMRLNLNQLQSRRNGAFEIQDFSSQCIGFAASPSPGEDWFDACAGAGGKTVQLADLMGGRGRISVYDVRKDKIRKDLLNRAGKAGFADMIRCENHSVPDKLFDGVLIDAPCSSSGRWRRNPEIKFMPPLMPMDELLRIQESLLENLSSCVKPGGKLVYATCSVSSRENHEQIQRFLNKHGDFSLSPFPSPHSGEMVSGGMLLTLPEDADCDASFVAVLTRSE